MSPEGNGRDSGLAGNLEFRVNGRTRLCLSTFSEGFRIVNEFVPEYVALLMSGMVPNTSSLLRWTSGLKVCNKSFNFKGVVVAPYDVVILPHRKEVHYNDFSTLRNSEAWDFAVDCLLKMGYHPPVPYKNLRTREEAFGNLIGDLVP